MSAWKIMVGILSIFFNSQEVATRKPCFEKSIFIRYRFLYCCVGLPSVGLVVHFLVACGPHDKTLTWREFWTALILVVFNYTSNILAGLIQGSGRTRRDRNAKLGKPCSKSQNRQIVLSIYKRIRKITLSKLRGPFVRHKTKKRSIESATTPPLTLLLY
jgi:hypothetical protein